MFGTPALRYLLCIPGKGFGLTHIAAKKTTMGSGFMAATCSDEKVILHFESKTLINDEFVI